VEFLVEVSEILVPEQFALGKTRILIEKREILVFKNNKNEEKKKSI
jgi:hypothetical protein